MQKPEDIRNLIQQVRDRFGGIDILVNNAALDLAY
jgi:NAD(P)-dependent dehydrogenase (short-subunit alcohol dehydrogenase family)